MKEIVKIPPYRYKKCKVCGKVFESYNGMEICSIECKKIRNREIWEKANNKRKDGTSGNPEKIICKRCGVEFFVVNRRYCDNCRSLARKEKNKEIQDNYRRK